jgi:hypothetical protein
MTISRAVCGVLGAGGMCSTVVVHAQGLTYHVLELQIPRTDLEAQPLPASQ